MALTDRTVNLEAAIRFDVNGNFVRAYRMPVYQVLNNGGSVVVASRADPPVELTLAQLKTYVAAL